MQHPKDRRYDRGYRGHDADGMEIYCDCNDCKRYKKRRGWKHPRERRDEDRFAAQLTLTA